MKKEKDSKGKKENFLTAVTKLRPTYEDIQLINPKKEPLTPQILRSFGGFADISEEQAQSICITSLLFAQILLETIGRKNAMSIDNQHVVCLSEEIETPVIEINPCNSKPSKNKAA